MRITAMLAWALVALCVQGCYIGPTFLDEVEVSPPTASVDGKTFIASRVMTSERTVETRLASPGLQEILETATVKDAGPDLADQLNLRGLSVQYRSGLRQEDLREDQLLITGNIVPRTPNPLFTGTGLQITSSLTHLITAVAVLYLLPFPIPIFTYLEVDYDVRVIDHEGLVIVRANGTTRLSFRHHMTIPAFSWRGDAELYQSGMPKFMELLADEMSKRLK